MSKHEETLREMERVNGPLPWSKPDISTLKRRKLGFIYETFEPLTTEQWCEGMRELSLQINEAIAEGGLYFDLCFIDRPEEKGIWGHAYNQKINPLEVSGVVRSILEAKAIEGSAPRWVDIPIES